MNLLNGKIGRIVFAIPFGIFGMMHIAMAENMAGMVPAFIPGGVLWVYVTGIALIVASAALISGKLVRQASLGLAAMMATFVLTLHIPGMMNEATMQMAMSGFLKDTSLMGAALIVAASTYSYKVKVENSN